MTNTEKLTDRKIYAAIVDGTFEDLDVDTIVAWAEKKIAQLDRKAAKAKETAAGVEKGEVVVKDDGKSRKLVGYRLVG